MYTESVSALCALDSAFASEPSSSFPIPDGVFATVNASSAIAGQFTVHCDMESTPGERLSGSSDESDSLVAVELERLR